MAVPNSTTTPTRSVKRDPEAFALESVYYFQNFEPSTVGIILTSGLRYRLYSSELVPSATKTYNARLARSYRAYDCHYPMLKRFPYAYWLIPLQTLTDHEHG
jgi:hypothetical protein